MFFYLYLIVESSAAVGWEVHERESADLPEGRAGRRLYRAPLVLHATTASL